VPEKTPSKRGEILKKARWWHEERASETSPENLLAEILRCSIAKQSPKWGRRWMRKCKRTRKKLRESERKEEKIIKYQYICEQCHASCGVTLFTNPPKI